MDGLKDGGREGRREGGREGGTDGVSEGLASAEDAGRRPSGAGAFRRYTQCPWVGSGVRVRYLAPALSRPALSRAASTVSFRTFVHRALCDRMRGVARLVAPARRPRTCAGAGPLHPRCGESGRPTRCGGSGPKAGAGAGSRSRGRFPFRVVRQPRGPDCAAPAPAFGQPPLLSMAGPSPLLSMAGPSPLLSMAAVFATVNGRAVPSANLLYCRWPGRRRARPLTTQPAATRRWAAHSVAARGVECVLVRPFPDLLGAGAGRPQCHGTRCRLCGPGACACLRPASPYCHFPGRGAGSRPGRPRCDGTRCRLWQGAPVLGQSPLRVFGRRVGEGAASRPRGRGRTWRAPLVAS